MEFQKNVFLFAIGRREIFLFLAGAFNMLVLVQNVNKCCRMSKKYVIQLCVQFDTNVFVCFCVYTAFHHM